ncbi:MAG: DUF6612 family protein [Lachnospiraceae bacterium]
MMRNKKRCLAGMLIISALALTGCGQKKVTAESLLKEAQANMQKMESFTGDMDMQISMGMSSDEMGMNMNIDMGMDGTFESMTDPQIFHLDGSMTMSMLGMSMDMEVYTQAEEDKIVTYTGVMGTWVKQETDLDENVETLQDMYSMVGDGQDMILAEKTEMFDGREVYVLTAKVSGEQLESLLGQMESMTGEMGTMDLSSMTADVTMKIYKDMMLPASVIVDMTVGGEGMESNGMTVTLDKMNVTMNYTGYNDVENITIPEEALNAQAADSMLEDENTDM